jgi:hypothetical protein
MGLLDEEFYCEKCNWFTYRHSPVPYIKPAPRCPRCGLETRIATGNDIRKAVSLGPTVHHVHDEFTNAVSLKEALEMTRDYDDYRYPIVRHPSASAIVPRKDVLKQAEITNRRCRECTIILLNGDDTGLCDICLTMFNAIAHQPGLLEAHVKWEVENQRRITQKQRLMRD